MKLAPRDAASYFARPDPAMPGLLIYGEDAMRVALKRQEVVAAMVGPEGESEMRLSRQPGPALTRDPAMILDELKATSFFPGTRVLLIDEATNALTEAVSAALDAWEDGDGHLVLTAGALKPSSSLRKLFEGHKKAYAAAIYDDPPSRAEIEATLRKAFSGEIGREAMGEIETLARSLDPGDFRQTVEKLALYKLGDTAPLTPDDVAAVAPVSTEADLDAALDVVAEARPPEIGPLLRRLEAQGQTPVGLCIAATRHFRSLYTLACDPEGPARAAGRMRPPLHFKRRDRMVRQAQKWSPPKLETAIRMLTDTDLTLRSSARAPDMALMERTLVRLAVLGQR